MAEPLTTRQRAQALSEFEEWRQDNAPTALPNVAIESYLSTLFAADLLDTLTEAANQLHKDNPTLAARLRAISGGPTS